ncbi:MAG TPA: hypothetical protein PKV71_03625 [Calditrichia bacterium]|nr:hypothetical protein [Calditrichota bacterium]HQV30936.1 hypothetical protein [Calditrichia bacterium]
MPLQIKNFLENRDLKLLLLDFLMLLLLLVNLGLILFDWIFSSAVVQGYLQAWLPAFYAWYRHTIHLDFVRIDLLFVAVFVAELLFRWGVAAYSRTYHRWFFYPFIHWYDVLGCIPVGSFRFLRILRVITIVVRLQKLQLVDLTRTYLFEVFRKYYEVLVEEISDRVVVNVISGIQSEVREGNPLVERILSEVIIPRKGALVGWLSHRVRDISNHVHGAYHEDIQAYVDRRIAEAVAKNGEIRTIALVPLLGEPIAKSLENTIADIVYNVINGMIIDLASAGNQGVIDDVADVVIDTLLKADREGELETVAQQMVLQALELIKEQVQVQQWKVREARKD